MRLIFLIRCKTIFMILIISCQGFEPLGRKSWKTRTYLSFTTIAANALLTQGALTSRAIVSNCFFRDLMAWIGNHMPKLQQLYSYITRFTKRLIPSWAVLMPQKMNYICKRKNASGNELQQWQSSQGFLLNQMTGISINIMMCRNIVLLHT